MNRLNRNLTINISQDTFNKTQSPVPPSQQKQYMPFQEHLQSDSQKQKVTPYQMNLIEFEEFTVEKRNRHQDKQDKHQFVIEIPDSKGKSPNRFKNTYIRSQKNTQDFKQPPAPSKGSSKNKVFVFPATTDQNTSSQWEKLQILKAEFEKERQQFYKEKSKYQKELLIKDGQIEMLQKIVTEKYSHKRSSTQQLDFGEMESILIQKDVKINQLLEKINYISQNLQRKCQQYNKVKYQNSQLETLIESLRDQLYIYQKKENNQRHTKQFFNLKQQKTSRNKWEEEHLKQDFAIKGIEQLHKKLEFLKNNRIELEERKKNKSEFVYSQTSKSKSKGLFDFKGKIYGAEVQNRNIY